MHAATNKRTTLCRDGDGGVDEARERAESRELRDGGQDGGIRFAGNEVRDRRNVPRRRRRVARANNPLRPAHARVTKITRAAVQQVKQILWGCGVLLHPKSNSSQNISQTRKKNRAESKRNQPRCGVDNRDSTETKTKIWTGRG
jgi:hypothetical protein